MKNRKKRHEEIDLNLMARSIVERASGAPLMSEKDKKTAGQKPCECGCGKYPKKAGSRFLPGHDLRKAYQDQVAIPKKPQ
jgi:hypothetical protein